MKVLTLMGGARKKGNTAAVTARVVEELEALGHDVEIEYLQNKEIKGCLACMKCKDDADMVGCVQKDDALGLLEKMAAANLVLFTSPLYFWGLAGPLKTFIDRTFSLYVNYHKPDHASLVEGQRQALLVTGGGPYENNVEATFTAFGRLQNPHKAVNAGEMYVGGCSTPDKLEAITMENAVSFARKISEEGGAAKG